MQILSQVITTSFFKGFNISGSKISGIFKRIMKKSTHKIFVQSKSLPEFLKIPLNNFFLKSINGPLLTSFRRSFYLITFFYTLSYINSTFFRCYKNFGSREYLNIFFTIDK